MLTFEIKFYYSNESPQTSLILAESEQTVRASLPVGIRVIYIVQL
jgi:hypothetical protein